MIVIRLSPGILVSSHHLLKKMKIHESNEILLHYAKNKSIDGTKTQDVIDTIILCSWIEVIDNTARLTPRGVHIATYFDNDVNLKSRKNISRREPRHQERCKASSACL